MECENIPCNRETGKFEKRNGKTMRILGISEVRWLEGKRFVVKKVQNNQYSWNEGTKRKRDHNK